MCQVYAGAISYTHVPSNPINTHRSKSSPPHRGANISPRFRRLSWSAQRKFAAICHSHHRPRAKGADARKKSSFVWRRLTSDTSVVGPVQLLPQTTSKISNLKNGRNKKALLCISLVKRTVLFGRQRCLLIAFKKNKNSMFRKIGTVTRKSSSGIYLLIFTQLSFIFASYKH